MAPLQQSEISLITSVLPTCLVPPSNFSCFSPKPPRPLSQDLRVPTSFFLICYMSDISQLKENLQITKEFLTEISVIT